jgi:hypothetical protein
MKRNLYVTREGAWGDAKRIRQFLGVELSDGAEEGIAYPNHSGGKIEAVALASRTPGVATIQAKGTSSLDAYVFDRGDIAWSLTRSSRPAASSNGAAACAGTGDPSQIARFAVA